MSNQTKTNPLIDVLGDPDFDEKVQFSRENGETKLNVDKKLFHHIVQLVKDNPEKAASLLIARLAIMRIQLNIIEDRDKEIRHLRICFYVVYILFVILVILYFISILS